MCAIKNENEKLLKEHTGYENTIQQALLRSVSCLNVKALKILKNPPLTSIPIVLPAIFQQRNALKEYLAYWN